MHAFCAPPPTTSLRRRLSKKVSTIGRAKPKETGADDVVAAMLAPQPPKGVAAMHCPAVEGRYSAIFAGGTG